MHGCKVGSELNLLVFAMLYRLLQGMTIVHLLACSGRAHELQQLMDVLFRMQGDGVETVRRWVALQVTERASCRLLHQQPRPHAWVHRCAPSAQLCRALL